jgi:CRP/FNR family transcriptional regulator, cyclic AMP receptor protein
MNSRQSLATRNRCESCRLRSGVCDFNTDTLQKLNANGIALSFPEKALLASEGEPAKGVYILCAGKVKLSSMSREGRSVILRIAQPGEMVGLNAVVSDRPSESTAETLCPSQVIYIHSADFRRLVHNQPNLALQVAQSLSKECVSAYQEIRTLALSPSCTSRLAGLLLSWMGQRTHTDENTDVRIHSSYTQEEIAAMIGTTRETVSRMLADLKRKQVIASKGAIVTVRNVAALEALAV